MQAETDKMTKQLPEPYPQIVAVGKDGKVADMQILEDQNVAFDPTKATLDLTKEEKRRTTALLLAIQAYDKLIIKDAEMYNAISHDRERHNGPVIQPATMQAMVEAAIDFDMFISGELQSRLAKAEVKSVESANKAEK